MDEKPSVCGGTLEGVRDHASFTKEELAGDSSASRRRGVFVILI